MMRSAALTLAVLSATCCACVKVDDINDSFRRVDRIWQLEYQQTEDLHRYRVVDADPSIVLGVVRRTFIDIGMPVQEVRGNTGVVIAETQAPTPLTKQEWISVAAAENKRLTDVSNGHLKLSDDPKD